MRAAHTVQQVYYCARYPTATEKSDIYMYLFQIPNPNCTCAHQPNLSLLQSNFAKKAVIETTPSTTEWDLSRKKRRIFRTKAYTLQIVLALHLLANRTVFWKVGGSLFRMLRSFCIGFSVQFLSYCKGNSLVLQYILDNWIMNIYMWAKSRFTTKVASDKWSNWPWWSTHLPQGGLWFKSRP